MRPALSREFSGLFLGVSEHSSRRIKAAAGQMPTAAFMWDALAKKMPRGRTKTESKPSVSGFDSERSFDRVSERRLLQKSRRERYAVRGDVVEPAGIEPASESALEGTSPGAACLQNSRPRLRTRRQPGLVASSCMVRAKLTARTFTTHRRPAPGPWCSRVGRPLFKQRREQRCRCSLIYNCPF